MIDFSKINGFEWDMGNYDKNWAKHKVEWQECEEAFFDSGLKQYKDKLHSGKEERYIALGKTAHGRILYIAFTIRNNKIRVISARDLNRKEMYLYEN